MYTAYTFLGLTSTAFKVGSIAFFATPYVVLAYPIAYFFLPKLWKVGKTHKFTTLADYIKGRFESKLLSVLVAITGVFMLIPYIDLQLSGILDTIKVAGNGQINVVLVVTVSFFLVALYTFFSGIKAPTYTAIIKVFRNHKSYLVNLNHIVELKAWVNGAYNLIMEDSTRSSVPVSRNYVKELRMKLEI